MVTCWFLAYLMLNILVIYLELFRFTIHLCNVYMIYLYSVTLT